MLKFLLGLGIAGIVTSSVYAGMVLAGALSYLRSRRAKSSAGFAPPVTLLKPLHGAEPDLEAHLETFFHQNYPRYEIVFCARHSRDEGLEIAKQVAERHPDVLVKFVTTGEPDHINAKVSSLVRMEAVAAHDILIISDSDVRVSPDYIASVVAPFADPEVGLSTCLYRGVAAEGGLWSRLEAAGMSVEMTAGVLVARMVEGVRFALGPTMVVRRGCVREIGGFGVLGYYCADDFVLGHLVANAGHKVVLSDHVIDHIVINASFIATVKHQVRWMKSTRFSRPKGHLGTALTFSLPFGLIAAAAALAMGQITLAVMLLGWSIATRVAMARVVGGAVLKERGLWRLAVLYPIRDLMGFGFWAASYLNNKVLWRGEIYALAPGGLMLPTATSSSGKRREPALTA